MMGCSMTARVGQPWRCASGACLGRSSDCTVPRRNAAEAAWVHQMEQERETRTGRFDPFLCATRYELGEADPGITLEDARNAMATATRQKPEARNA